MEHLKDFSLLSFRIQSNDVLKAIETPIPAKAIERLQQAKPGRNRSLPAGKSLHPFNSHKFCCQC